MRVAFRRMLSSAHVLAMDAKNLLDVVDSIRIKYPHVHSAIQSESNSSSNASSLEKRHSPNNAAASAATSR